MEKGKIPSVAPRSGIRISGTSPSRPALRERDTGGGCGFTESDFGFTSPCAPEKENDFCSMVCVSLTSGAVDAGLEKDFDEVEDFRSSLELIVSCSPFNSTSNLLRRDEGSL